MSRNKWQITLYSTCVGLGCYLLVMSGFCQPAPDAPVAWEIGINSNSDSSPAVGVDGTIYFGAWNCKFWALNPDGTCKWVFTANSEIKSSPAVGKDGSVYFGARDRYVYAVRADGKLRWKFRTGGWVDSSPALANDGSIFFGSWDGEFYALTSPGTKLWSFKTGGPVVSSPAIGTNGTLYFGSHDARLYALGCDGKKLWEFKTGGPIISSPALGADGGIYFTSVDGNLYALDGGGRLRWRLRTGSPTESSPVLGAAGAVFVGVSNELWAVSAQGEKLWAKGDEDVIRAAPMVLSNGTVCYLSQYGMMRAVVEETKGQSLDWHFYLYGHGSSAPGIGADGTIYTWGKWSQFYALKSRASLAASAWPKFRGNARNTGNIADSFERGVAGQ